jgi:dephospho-CoA kinase|tara:strand:- start:111 stop:671 length:561 start_codon:yes stop_codon:yes gene_type:complete
MKQVIGVTGRVGVGKTFLVNGLADSLANYEVVDLDLIGHEVLKKEAVKEDLIKLFGKKILTESNEINRKQLGALVFSKKEYLDSLNAISHPWIKKIAQERIQQSTFPVIIMVGALIKEIELLNECKFVVLIQADHGQRHRNLKSKKNIESFQASDDDYKVFSTHIFENVFSKDSVENFSKLVQNLL